MIVKCEQCQTRFKIPDEKVTDKGVKVRCTKCQHTFRVKRDGTTAGTGQFAAVAPTQPAVPAAKPPVRADDPFAKFGTAPDDGMGEATRPGMYALGVEASRNPGGPLQPSFAAQMDTPAQVFEQPTRVGQLPPAPPGRKQLRDEPTSPASPFDFAAALGSAEPPPPPPFDFAAPPPPQAPEPYQPPPPPPPPARPTATERFAASSVAPPPPPPPQPADPFASMELGEATVPTGAAMTQPEMPSAFGDGGAFFDSNALPPSDPSRGMGQPVMPDGLGLPEDGQVEADTSARASLFDMPAVSDVPPPAFEDPGVAPIGKLNLVKAPAGGTPVTAPAQEAFEPSRPKRKVGGLIFNVLIASVLVGVLTVTGTVYLTEGKVELASFSPERLKATFSSPTDWSAQDISNGLYDTKSGRPVFFVRGEVKNRTGKATRAKVRAEILDGNASIRHADAWIGTAPSPEDLFSISVSDDVDRLMAKLEQSAAEVMPGEKRAFLVPFYEYPPDLKGFRVRVTVIEAAGKGETAAR